MNAAFWTTVRLGVKSLLLHKLRSALTMLGIIFGVSSVIIMLAVGEGASQSAQDQIKGLGSENIIIDSVELPETQGNDQEIFGQEIIEYGLTSEDLERLEGTIPKVAAVVPQILSRKPIRYARREITGNVIGTVAHYSMVHPVSVLAGRFLTVNDERHKTNVCVVTEPLVRRLFSDADPLRSAIRVGDTYFQIVGIVTAGGTKDRVETSGNLDDPGVVGESTVYLPFATARARLGEVMNQKKVEISRIILRMEDQQAVIPAEQQIRHLLSTGHPKKDWEMTVPLQLLEQARASKRMFNIVLGSIAAVSLLVGGIGIMNIMLATVTERTREIGIRRALGAKKTDIIQQFLIETVVLSVIGGLIGLLIGVVSPGIITAVADLQTIVTWWAVGLAFGISVMIGIVFGLYPAYQAAQLDPIEALRQE